MPWPKPVTYRVVPERDMARRRQGDIASSIGNGKERKGERWADWQGDGCHDELVTNVVIVMDERG